ncbi:putative invertase inhibitor [Iris pallida]|uniref:Invertase inhibitor n=1 Tax=Iris pallida TaxID=29817 RepID=A0AAX6IFU4_IRIPA|nr:putative invertase inhibitor [Iris pallida]
MHSFSVPSLFILFFLSTTLFSSSAAVASVEETCKGITSVRPDVGYDFCVSSLESDPDSVSADPDGLAVVAIRLSIANATAVAAKIESLMRGGEEDQSDPSLRECLGVCAEVYSDAVDHLNQALASIRARSYGDAVTFLSAALDAADNCEDAFGDLGWGTSPVAAEDRDYGRLADIALAIGASLGR